MSAIACSNEGILCPSRARSLRGIRWRRAVAVAVSAIRRWRSRRRERCTAADAFVDVVRRQIAPIRPSRDAHDRVHDSIVARRLLARLDLVHIDARRGALVESEKECATLK